MSDTPASAPGPDRGDRPELAVDYFDGRTARPHQVRLRISGSALHIHGSGVARSVPLAEVQWPERTEGGRCVAHLKEGGALHGANAADWDAWARASGLRESRVVTVQQSWRLSAAAGVLLVLMIVAAYLWGLPVVARATVALVPTHVDSTIGDTVFESIQARWLSPSALPVEQQARLRTAFERAVRAADGDADRVAFQLHFRAGRIGPNAFALPGGHIVMTDELVQLVDGREDVLVGVLAHELGHVRHRHGLRMLVQATLIGVASSLAFGDFSSILAAAPALLGTAAYSRDHEREADAEAVRVMRAAGLSPAAMVVLFEKLGAARQARAGKSAPGAAPAPGTADAPGKANTPGAGSPAPRDHEDQPSRAKEADALGIAFSSHPADEERIRFFTEAAAR